MSDDALASARVSPSGVISFTAGNGLATWTFTGTASGTSIIDGRHTLSDGDESVSGPWRGDAAGSIPDIRMAPNRTGDLLYRLRTLAH